MTDNLPHYMFKIFFTIPSWTWGLFKIFKRASQRAFNNNIRDYEDLLRPSFQLFHYWIFPPLQGFYGLHVSSSPNLFFFLFFFCGSSTETAFPFLFLSLLSTNFYGLYTSLVWVTPLISKICWLSFPSIIKTGVVTGLPDEMVNLKILRQRL